MPPGQEVDPLPVFRLFGLADDGDAGRQKPAACTQGRSQGLGTAEASLGLAARQGLLRPLEKERGLAQLAGGPWVGTGGRFGRLQPCKLLSDN